MPVSQINNLQNSSFDSNATGVANNNSQIDKQYNFIVSALNDNNEIIFTIDTEQFSKEYGVCSYYEDDYYEDELDFFIDKKEKTIYIDKLLNNLLELKIEKKNKNTSFHVVTQNYSELEKKRPCKPNCVNHLYL